MRDFKGLTALALVLAGMTGPALAEDLKIGFINKMGDHPWFVAEVAGAKAKAEELGAGFVSQDVQFDANLTITTLDTMIGDGVDGIAIVVPDKALGPVVAAKAKEAGIPLIAVDDDITFEDGSPVPYVGMNAKNIGVAVGTELAAIYNAEGWADKNVRVVSIEDRKADTCMQRNMGAEEAFLKGVPGFDPANIIRVAYDNTMVNSIDVMTTTLTGNPEVTNWVFYSCNDDGVLGAARAMENAGYTADQGLGIGIDGSRACDAFGGGTPSGFRGTMWLNSANHGRDAVAALVAAAKDGTELPLATYSDPEFINAENFETTYKAQLCK
ncbi:substrate-binding domain-containing protein [uncultured Paracoccus sp.]|uniref:substrate-binding domain-containing protein n=1 Tax=uncultured Paracoccus sp. TaxID=189685 RepID=UPI002623D2AF|nr:substrate-binding domain-containing protein [uncultured Paracoccus sp.]